MPNPYLSSQSDVILYAISTGFGEWKGQGAAERTFPASDSLLRQAHFARSGQPLSLVEISISSWNEISPVLAGL